MIGRRRGFGLLRALACILAVGLGVGVAELQASFVGGGSSGGRASSKTASGERARRVEQFRVPSARVDARSLHHGLGESYRDGLVITGSTPHRLILFTFDDGPDHRTTPLLLDRLDQAGVHAVFFLVAGRFAGNTSLERQNAGVAREIVKRGHIVGNHTLDHEQLPLLDGEGARSQIIEAEQIFERTFGARPWLFRPPFGARSQRIDKLTADRGYTTLMWNLGGGDFQVRSADEVFDTWVRVFERREEENGDRGGVILLHDTYPWTVDAFERIVSHLQARNCDLLAKGEELFDFVEDPSFFFTPRADGGASDDAPAAKLSPEQLEERQAKLRERETLRCGSLASSY